MAEIFCKYEQKKKQVLPFDYAQGRLWAYPKAPGLRMTTFLVAGEDNAGPSTALRSGRDDGLKIVSEYFQSWQAIIVIANLPRGHRYGGIIHATADY